MSEYEEMLSAQEKRQAELAAWHIEQDRLNTQQLAVLAARRGTVRTGHKVDPTAPVVALDEPIEPENTEPLVINPPITVKP